MDNLRVLVKYSALCYNASMTRIKIIKDYKQYIKGRTLQVSPNEAFGLIELGVAIISKDMTAIDYKQATLKARLKKSGLKPRARKLREK